MYTYMYIYTCIDVVLPEPLAEGEGRVLRVAGVGVGRLVPVGRVG